MMSTDDTSKRHVPLDLPKPMKKSGTPPGPRKSLDEVPIEENDEAVEEVKQAVEKNRKKSVAVEAAARQLEKKDTTKKRTRRKKPTEKVDPKPKKPSPTKGTKKRKKGKASLPDEYKDIEYYHAEDGTTFQYTKNMRGLLLISRNSKTVQVPWTDLMKFLAKEVIAKKLHARIDELTPEELIGMPNLVLYPPNIEVVRHKLKKPSSKDPGELFESHLRTVRGRAGHKFPTIKDPPPFMRRAKRKKDPDFSGLVMTRELLEILDIRPQTLFNWRDTGFFPQPKKVEGKNFWPKEVVKAWLKSHYKKGGRWFSLDDIDPQMEFRVDWEENIVRDPWEELSKEAYADGSIYDRLDES